METEIITHIFSVLQFIPVETGQLILTPVGEAVVESWDKCLELVTEFNQQAAGTGALGICTVLVETAINH